MSLFIFPNIHPIHPTQKLFGDYTALNKVLIFNLAKLSTTYLFKPPAQLSIIIKYYYLLRCNLYAISNSN